jgi:hypothetical protein
MYICKAVALIVFLFLEKYFFSLSKLIDDAMMVLINSGPRGLVTGL